jgi:hypothetical protein
MIMKSVRNIDIAAGMCFGQRNKVELADVLSPIAIVQFVS